MQFARQFYLAVNESQNNENIKQLNRKRKTAEETVRKCQIKNIRLKIEKQKIDQKAESWQAMASGLGVGG